MALEDASPVTSRNDGSPHERATRASVPTFLADEGATTAANQRSPPCETRRSNGCRRPASVQSWTQEERSQRIVKPPRPQRWLLLSPTYSSGWPRRKGVCAPRNGPSGHDDAPLQFGQASVGRSPGRSRKRCSRADPRTVVV